MSSTEGVARTEIVLVRHGETRWNAEHRIQGHDDSPLTKRGRAQISAVAEALNGRPVAALYSSDLPRARETSRIIGAHLGLDVRFDTRLRERQLGVLEGRTMQDVEGQDPELYRMWRGADPDWPVPGGESLRQRHDRVVAAISDIAQAHQGQRVLVVTHGGGLDSAFRHAVGLPLTTPRRFALHNAGINVLQMVDGRWLVSTWGSTSHLGLVEP